MKACRNKMHHPAQFSLAESGEGEGSSQVGRVERERGHDGRQWPSGASFCSTPVLVRMHALAAFPLALLLVSHALSRSRFVGARHDDIKLMSTTENQGLLICGQCKLPRHALVQDIRSLILNYLRVSLYLTWTMCSSFSNDCLDLLVLVLSLLGDL